MSETQEHKDNTEVKGLFKGAMFQENYRKDRALYLSIVESKLQDIINVYCGGKHIMLCQRDNGYAEWKRDFDKDYRQLSDSQIKYYLTGKEK